MLFVVPLLSPSQKAITLSQLSIISLFLIIPARFPNLLQFAGNIFNWYVFFKRVLEYCWSIGFTNEFIEYFNIKYFKKCAFIYDVTKQPKYYYNRIVIPCLLNNKVYNYECRDFTRKSSKKVLYPSMAENDFSLFNFDNINKDKEVVVVRRYKRAFNCLVLLFT